MGAVIKTTGLSGSLTNASGTSLLAPTIVESPDNTSTDYRLIITDKNGSYVTPNLIGPAGSGSGSGSAGSGAPGADGFSPIIEVTPIENGYTLTITDKDGTETITLTNGSDGAPGPAGENGATFIPAVDSNGNVSWTNNRGLENPSPVNIKGPKGDKGDAGSKGDKGEPGPQGPKGDKGEKGEDGTGVTILGSYASEAELNSAHPTGAPGDSYLVGGNLYVWSETENKWKDVGIIRGPQGEVGPAGPQGIQGEQGPTGAQGEKGDKGDTGAVGPQGPKGDKGDTGLQGPQGIQGEKGEKGDPGVQGPAGAQGEQGVQGPKGDKGDTGAQGEQGDSGVYLGAEEPTDPDVNVWINPNGTPVEVGGGTAAEVSFDDTTAGLGAGNPNAPIDTVQKAIEALAEDDIGSEQVQDMIDNNMKNGLKFGYSSIFGYQNGPTTPVLRSSFDTVSTFLQSLNNNNLGERKIWYQDRADENLTFTIPRMPIYRGTGDGFSNVNCTFTFKKNHYYEVLYCGANAHNLLITIMNRFNNRYILKWFFDAPERDNQITDGSTGHRTIGDKWVAIICPPAYGSSPLYFIKDVTGEFTMDSLEPRITALETAGTGPTETRVQEMIDTSIAAIADYEGVSF